MYKDGKISLREKIYIIKDILIKLVEHGELNLTALISFCGLNINKHKPLLYYIEAKKLIERTQVSIGKRLITVYKISYDGLEFCRRILEPYETLFPRSMDLRHYRHQPSPSSLSSAYHHQDQIQK